jgi:transglutaminase/protease-like cytokinesis protein 3
VIVGRKTPLNGLSRGKLTKKRFNVNQLLYFIELPDVKGNIADESRDVIEVLKIEIVESVICLLALKLYILSH